MKIVIVPSIFPTKNNKMAGIFIWEQCIAMKNAGYEICVLDVTSRNYKNWFSGECFKLKKEKKEGIQIYSFNFPAIASSRIPKITSYVTTICLNKLWGLMIRDGYDPDIIHAHMVAFAGVSSVHFSEKYNIPLVITEHNSMFLNKTLSRTTQNMLTSVVYHSEKFICVSSFIKDSIEKQIGNDKKLLVINNLINTSFKYRERVEKKSFVFFSAGNLVNIKKMDLLIEAFFEAYSNDDEVFLEIAGDGEEYSKLNSMISQYNMEGRIRLLGRIDRDLIKDKMEFCDVFILLSEKETFGVAYREALASGRPIIATKNGGVQENWDDNNGILIDINDIKQASEALKSIKEHYSKYNLSQISDRCIELYSEEVIVNKISKVYENIINKKE